MVLSHLSAGRGYGSKLDRPPGGQTGEIQISVREITMQARLLRLRFMLHDLMHEEGQDLIEYALVVALIALAATAGMNTVATDINLAFSNIGRKARVQW